jgi:hypothetical protein
LLFRLLARRTLSFPDQRFKPFAFLAAQPHDIFFTKISLGSHDCLPRRSLATNAKSNWLKRATSPLQQVGKRFGVADDRIACEAKRLERSLSSSFVTGTASISDDHRNEAQVRGVAGGWLDPNFCCDSYDGD